MVNLLEEVLYFLNKNENFKMKGKMSSRILDITSEAGELAKEVLKSSNYGQGETVITRDLEGEYGDLLYSVLALGLENELNIPNILKDTIEKMERRINRNGFGSTPVTSPEIKVTKVDDSDLFTGIIHNKCDYAIFNHSELNLYNIGPAGLTTLKLYTNDIPYSQTDLTVSEEGNVYNRPGIIIGKVKEVVTDGKYHSFKDVFDNLMTCGRNMKVGVKIDVDESKNTRGIVPQTILKDIHIKLDGSDKVIKAFIDTEKPKLKTLIKISSNKSLPPNSPKAELTSLFNMMYDLIGYVNLDNGYVYNTNKEYIGEVADNKFGSNIVQHEIGKIHNKKPIDLIPGQKYILTYINSEISPIDVIIGDPEEVSVFTSPSGKIEIAPIYNTNRKLEGYVDVDGCCYSIDGTLMGHITYSYESSTSKTNNDICGKKCMIVYRDNRPSTEVTLGEAREIFNVNDTDRLPVYDINKKYIGSVDVYGNFYNKSEIILGIMALGF